MIEREVVTSDTIDIVVVGAGVAGLSVASSLARGAQVVLLESEDHPGYHASGRSAAIFAQNYGSANIRALTAASESFFQNHDPNFSQTPLLSARGLACIALEGQVDALKTQYDEASTLTDLQWLHPEEIEARIPLLKKGIVQLSFLNEAAADIDVHALLSAYLRQLRACNASIHTDTKLVSAKYDGKLWHLETQKGQSFSAHVLVNAAGAWADEVATLAGVAPLGLIPKRRSALTLDAPQGYDLSTLPMIVDADERFFLKPEAGRLMASPCDETPSPPTDSRPEEIDIAVCLDRITRNFELGTPRPLSTWSGLRTFSCDRDPVCGWDPDVSGFFWLAGQGGYGVQTAPAMARIAADTILGEAEPFIKSVQGVDEKDLSPARFT